MSLSTLLVGLAQFMCLFLIIYSYCNFELCAPYKRRMEKMLSEIERHQHKQDLDAVYVDYKGKCFDVCVYYDNINVCCSQYQVYINRKHVKTLHILSHAFSKSREEQHHGKMRDYEECEIIRAAYKKIKKENKERFNKQWAESSYFD